jgi:argininosuccinate synthase
MSERRIVLAYSGGLDTSVAIRWLQEKYDVQVATLTIDLGMVNLEEIRQRALQIGAISAQTVDGKDTFVKDFIYPALRAGAIYEEQYPLATALGRPLIARYLIEAARKEGAYAIAHGCTGKGNDQVRFDVSVAALAPDLQVIAPIREWSMTRDEEIEYARLNNIPVPMSKGTYSTDENLWGRSIEAGDLEDPWQEPPEAAYAWTRGIDDTPSTPTYLEIGFEQGIPVSLDGEDMEGLDIIRHLNHLAGEHGVGRIDHIENRLVGIKSREVYESPAALVLHAAHKSLEAMTLSKEQLRLKAKIAQEYADVVYNGLWFTQHRRDMDAYISSTQRHVSGTIRARLHKGTCTVVGRKAPSALYNYELATYDRGDKFDHRSSEGFIAIYGLPVRTQAQVQGEAEVGQE